MLASKFRISKIHKILVPGDKSVSHRSVLFSALAKGESRITGFLEAEDPINTMKSFSELGVNYKKIGEGYYLVNSPGKENFKQPTKILDFGNGGTGIRLSAGLLAGLNEIQTELTGDASLLKRPMKRIIDPLTAMGAIIFSKNDDGKAPLLIKGKKLQNFQYKSSLSSAQVKSCLMLAAISSGVELDYEEEELSRDHTENMVRFLGGTIESKGKFRFILKPPYNFQGTEFKVPGDISSAAFFIVLGILSNNSEIIIQNVGLNPARIGILNVLQKMGAKIEIENEKSECGEKIGDLHVYSSELHRIEIAAELIPSIIDEIPILTIAGLFSSGGFKISHAEDLRAKESDRIHSMVHNLKKLGVEVAESQDGYEFEEQKELISKVTIESFMDHRIAMSFLVLKTILQNEIQIDDESWIETSFPTFHAILRELGV